MHAAIQASATYALSQHDAPPPDRGMAARPALGLRPPGAMRRGVRGQPEAVPFADAAEAWLWTMGALIARHEGASQRGGGSVRVVRPCDPDDVIRALDLLYRRGGIGPAYARVLCKRGERFLTPVGRDAALWQEAMEQLEGILRAKGIVS